MYTCRAYAPPTNPSVATLMRTEGGKTALKAVKQAKILHVYSCSSGD